MPTTTNFGWTTPADTDLVKDGASAMRTLGNGIDTSLVYLKGGTTGQILSKTSNTDMAFTWINNDQGDITAVTTTAPLQGGASTGAVALTIDTATTSAVGVVQLTNSTSSTSTTTAATPNSVKSAYDLADAALPKLITLNAQTDSYTLVAGDANKLVTIDKATGTTLTVPPSVFSTGQMIHIQQIGAGQVTFAQGSGVTITSTGGTSTAPKLRARYSAATVICTASNTFTILGDLS